MRYLLLKMRRDISKMWVQFFSVFMMSVLALTIYSGMEGVWYGLKCEVERYYEETALADAWVNGFPVTEEMLQKITALSGIKHAEGSMTMTVGLNTADETKADLKLLAMDTTRLFTPKLIEGEAFDAASEDGIWLDETLARERGIGIGDFIALTYGAQEKEFQVKGYILHSEFIYYTGSITDVVPNHIKHGYAVIGSEAARQLYGNAVCNEIRLDLEEESDIGIIQKEIEAILGDGYYSFFVRDDITSVNQIEKEISQMQNMANLFSAVFILLALLSMYTTMTRLINTQQIQIGTLKALGFSNFKIRTHYILYGLVVSLVGCLLGTVLGRLVVSPAVMRVKKATLTMPSWEVALSYRTYLIIAGIVVICVMAAIFASGRTLKKMPSEAMRVQAAGAAGNTKLFNPEKIFGWNRLEYNTKWMVRDIFRNKIRWIMSIIGVMGSMVLMMAGLGFLDSIEYSNAYVYNKQFTYEYKIVLSEQYTGEALEELLDLTQGKVQEIYEYKIDMYYPGSDLKETRVISVLGDGGYVQLEALNGEEVTLSDKSVAVSRKIADKLGVKEGDTLYCRILGRKEIVPFLITDIVIAPSPQGIFISDAFWEKELKETFSPSSLLIGEEDFLKIKHLEIVKEAASIEGQLSDMKVMTKSVMTIIYLMIAASLLLGCIIIYNLGMLNYIERFREYATMKVLGFYQKEIRSVIIRDCMITTITGWLIGIPVGYKFLNFYIGIVQFNNFEWIPVLSISGVIIASVVVILCSVLVHLFVAHKVTKISMVEALKSVEE